MRRALEQYGGRQAGAACCRRQGLTKGVRQEDDTPQGAKAKEEHADALTEEDAVMDCPAPTACHTNFQSIM